MNRRKNSHAMKKKLKVEIIIFIEFEPEKQNVFGHNIIFVFAR